MGKPIPEAHHICLEAVSAAPVAGAFGEIDLEGKNPVIGAIYRGPITPFVGLFHGIPCYSPTWRFIP